MIKKGNLSSMEKVVCQVTKDPSMMFPGLQWWVDLFTSSQVVAQLARLLCGKCKLRILHRYNCSTSLMSKKFLNIKHSKHNF